MTSHDVAEKAGVSVSAVSRAFRSGTSISAEKRRKILATAEKLNYRPNAIARGLITRRSNMVGIILARQVNLDYPELLVELTASFAEKGVQVLLFTFTEYSEIDAVLEQVLQYQVDGIVVTTSLTAAQRKKINLAQKPVIFYLCSPVDRPFNAAICNDREGEQWLVEQLIAAGHRRFGIVAGPSEVPVSNSRVADVVEFLGAHGVADVPMVGCDFTYEGARLAFRELMEVVDAPPDAVIAINDGVAIGCIDEAASGFGLRVPEDLSVVGFDGVTPSRYERYDLTTWRLPTGRLAEATASMLVNRIEQPDLPPEQRVFSGDPVPGSSARIPANRQHD